MFCLFFKMFMSETCLKFYINLICLEVLLILKYSLSHLTYEERIVLSRVPWKFQFHDAVISNLEKQSFYQMNQLSQLQAELRPRSTKKYKRFEYLCMNATERMCFHKGISTMKNKKIGMHNEYDLFVLFHDADKAPSAHNGPSFIIWHRFFLLMFELSIQRYFRNCMLPYWDNRLMARSGPNPRDSVFFSPDLAGNAYGYVTSGFAAGFLTPNSSSCQEISQKLSRAVPTNISGLFDEDLIKFVKQSSDYKELCYPWDETFELAHGLVHVFIGELMSYLSCAPSDPIFYLHHSFVDYVYERHFRQVFKNNYPNLNIIYPDISEVEELDDSYSADNVMMPFGILHEDMVNNNNFVPLYDTSPGDVECFKDEDCCSNKNTQFIWCNEIKKQCVSKIQQNGRVKPGFPARACYCKPPKLPFIRSGVCGCK